MNTENYLLEQCVLIKKNINKISSIMKRTNSVEQLDVTLAIKDIVNEFLEVVKFEEFDLSGGQIKNINNKIKKIKELLVDLKNRQVYFYNLKVQEINYRLSQIKKMDLSSKLEEKLSEVYELKFNDIYLYRDWKNSNYSKLFQYSELIKTNNIIDEVEKKLNIKYDESLEVKIKIDYFEHSLKNIKNNIDLYEVDILLDRCVSLFENVVEVDTLIRRYVVNGNITKIDKENYRLTNLYYELIKLKNQLLEEMESSEFYVLKDRLVILKKEVNKIQNVIYDYYDKCNSTIIKRFNIRLNYLKEDLINIKNNIVLLKNNNRLDINQVNRLFIDIEEIDNFFEVIDSQLKSYCLLDVDSILDKKEDNFSNLDNHSFAIRNIKSANNLYKNYKKECLYVSGLSAVALLENSPLIPAIMYSAISVGIKIPVLDEFADSINIILGGIINARQKEDGQWFLSNEIEIGPSVTVTSLFQGLVFSTEIDELIIKKIVNIGRKMKLKYKQLIKEDELVA